MSKTNLVQKIHPPLNDRLILVSEDWQTKPLVDIIGKSDQPCESLGLEDLFTRMWRGTQLGCDFEDARGVSYVRTSQNL